MKNYFIVQPKPSQFFEEKIDLTLNWRIVAWLDDIILITQGRRQEDVQELAKVSKILTTIDLGQFVGKEKSVYKKQFRPVFIFQNKLKKQIRRKTKRLQNWNHLKRIELEIFLQSGSIFFKIYRRHIRTNRRLTSLMEKDTKKNWTDERQGKFDKVKKYQN